MSIPSKIERSQLSHEEFETIRVTHHPAIYNLDGDALRALKLRLREQRDKARALARQKQREIRGKAEPRGKGFPGTVEQPLKRKQIFAGALKRVNNEIDRYTSWRRTSPTSRLRARRSRGIAPQNSCAIPRPLTRLVTACSRGPVPAG